MVIKSGRVTVNGSVEYDQGRKVKADDVILVNGATVSEEGEVYLALYKPAGVLCATEDDEDETVLDLVDGFTHKELHMAGRLDKDTTGLVLLTSDGQWSHRVTSPKFCCKKVYVLRTADPIPESVVEEFAKGIMLREELKATRPAHLELIGECEARLTITEGKYHQVKRMFGAVGNKVIELHRESVGRVTLRDLEPGEYYELTEEEILSFLQ